MGSMFKRVRLFNENSENGLTEVDAIVLNPEGTLEDTIDDTTAAISDISTKVIVDNNTDLSNAVEAVLENPEASESIQEGVMSNLWQRVKSFFEKIIAFVKGIVQKIKVKLGMYTKDATKFLNNYKEAINIAKKENKVADYKMTFEFYEGLLDKRFLDNISNKSNNGLDKVNENIENSFDELVEEGRNKEISDIDDQYNEIKKELEEKVEDVLKKTTEDLDSSKVSICLKFIEEYNKENTKIEKEYKELFNAINKAQRIAEKELKKFENKREKEGKNKQGDDLNNHNTETDEKVEAANVAIYQIKNGVKIFNLFKSTETGLRNKLRANAMAALRKHVSGWKKK